MKSAPSLEMKMALAGSSRVRTGDLIPSFRTQVSMISSKGRGREHVEEQSYGGADDQGAEATGGRAQGGGRGAGSGRRSIQSTPAKRSTAEWT